MRAPERFVDAVWRTNGGCMVEDVENLPRNRAEPAGDVYHLDGSSSPKSVVGKPRSCAHALPLGAAQRRLWSVYFS